MKRIFAILLVIGMLLACLAGYFAWGSYQFQQQAIHTQGKVTDLYYKGSGNNSSGSWYPEVTFTDDEGKSVVIESSVGSSSYRKSLGKSIGVVYSQGHSEEAQIDDVISLYFISIMAGVFSVVFILIGGIGVLLLSKGGRNAKLIHQGKPVQAEIVSVELNETINVNGRSPWRVVCQWLDPQSNKVYIFTSANLFYDPSSYLNDKKITVYLAHNNYKKYHVDLSMLPERA